MAPWNRWWMIDELYATLNSRKKPCQSKAAVEANSERKFAHTTPQNRRVVVEQSNMHIQSGIVFTILIETSRARFPLDRRFRHLKWPLPNAKEVFASKVILYNSYALKALATVGLSKIEAVLRSLEPNKRSGGLRQERRGSFGRGPTPYTCYQLVVFYTS